MKRQICDSNEGTHEISSKMIKTFFSNSSDPTAGLHVYWLDELYDQPLEYYNIERMRLRGIHDYLQTFNNVDQCDSIIRQRPEGKIFVVVNLSACPKFLVMVHDLQQVQMIYVYANGTEIDKLLGDSLKTYSKVT
jgi:hypothetical protein